MIAELIEHIPAMFIASADEAGFVPIKDAHDVTLIVRSNFTGDVTSCDLDHRIKINALLGTIIDDISTVTQMISIQRLTIEEELLSYGINEHSSIIVPQKVDFMISDLFNRRTT